MPDPRILVVFTTAHGQTRKIATHMAKSFTDDGFGAVLADLERVSDPLRTDDLDGVVVAGPVRFGRHPGGLRRFARRNRDALHGTESAFVSVSGAAMSDAPEALEEARAYAESFLERTGWTPDATLCVGGALAYTRYDPVTRWVMRAISRRNGLPTDTSRDHERTDWEDVDRFVEDFGRRVRKRRAARTRGRVPES